MGAADMDSFHLPWGIELTLYAQDGMVGESKSFTGKSNVDDHDFMECVQLPSEWVNKARSFSVRKFQDIGGARVAWNYFPATEGVELEVHYGFESSVTETTTTEQEFTLTYELGTEVGFGEDKMSEKLTESFR